MSRVQELAAAPAVCARDRDDAWAAARLARVEQGDSTALADLYDRYSRPVYSLAQRIIGDVTLAEDVVEEVFLALWRQPGRFGPAESGFAARLLSAAHHKAVDLVRRGEVSRRRAGPLVARAVPTVPVAADSRRPGEIAEVLPSGEHLRRALRRLPPHQREALTLAYFGGYTQSEISALTGTPLGTVRAHLHRAVSSLRDAHGDAEPTARPSSPPRMPATEVRTP